MRLVCVCVRYVWVLCKVLWRCNAGVTPVHALHLCDMESILGYGKVFLCCWYGVGKGDSLRVWNTSLFDLTKCAFLEL